jgi:hypothetical protein
MIAERYCGNGEQRGLRNSAARPMKRSLVTISIALTGIVVTIVIALRFKTPLALGWAALMVAFYGAFYVVEARLTKRESIRAKYSAQPKSQ